MKEAQVIIKRQQVSEKATRMKAAANQYVFEVAREANKLEIKHAVERLFNVKVAEVNTMNRQGKKKRQRTMSYGRTAASKRAVVTLQAGQSIEQT